jgi:hypothetical protein
LWATTIERLISGKPKVRSVFSSTSTALEDRGSRLPSSADSLPSPDGS